MNDEIKDILLELYNDKKFPPQDVEDLYSYVSEFEYKDFRKTLEEMENDGLLVQTSKKKKYTTPRSLGYEIGTLSMNKKGFGFVKLENSENPDVFISKSNISSAMNGDLVMLKITKFQTENDKPEGYIVKVFKRNIDTVVGRFMKLKDYGFVIPLSKKITKDIFIDSKFSNNASDGDFVKCKIINYAKKDKKPEGKIVEIIAGKGDKDIYFKSILAEYNLKLSFPDEVIDFANKIPNDINKNDYKDRLDLTDEFIFTIDGWDAKDLDDAISIKKLDNGNYELGVHIADVSEYVTYKNPIDIEAFNRATSIYLINTVIPMLPEKLSNGVCSLHPGVDRLTLSLIMEINSEGDVVKHKIVKSIINSKVRLVYDNVSDFLEGISDEVLDQNDKLKSSLPLANELAKILNARKQKRGAMDFDFPESSIVMDENGEVVDVSPEERRVANRIIEEFMLIANEVVAEEFYHLDIPFVYRIHEKPSLEKIENLSEILSIFGHKLKVRQGVHPKTLQDILEKIDDAKEKPLIQQLMLRSMQKACYSPNCLGHFSLSLKYYCHFTSPIRRYPDLQIHRIIKEHLDGKISNSRIKNYAPIVKKASEQSSIKEQLADDVEHDVDDLRMSQYMKKFVGEEFEGIISSITNFGIFVMLENTIEGLIRLSDMEDDYYIFNSKDYTLTGERSGKKYSIGEKVNILVANVSIENREIDFVFANDEDY